MPLYIVGLGASAGGVEALMALIPELKINGKVSYLIAQHMAHDGHSDLMARLLNKGAGMPVLIAQDGQNILPDQIYLIPAGKDGTVQSNVIKLSNPLAQHISTPSVNFLFESLARAYENNAYGVVLSGTGSDGTQGIKAIKASGGTTIAQHKDSAIFNGMPTSAVESGMIDLILSIQDIGVELNKIVPTNKAPIFFDKSSKPESANQVLVSIIDQIQQVTGINFNGYKEETLWRRLDSRMTSLGVKSYEDYLMHISQNSTELMRIQQLFLVSFSSFFRDESSFEFLKSLLRQKMLTKSSSDVFMIWVAACASGEEVYTLAIIATELKFELGLDLFIKIIGVDLNPTAIQHAIKGLYGGRIAKDLKPNLIKKYFKHHDEGLVVSDEVKLLCEFHIGNIFNFLPNANPDLISCRNLLIYLKGQEQDRLIHKFYEHLDLNGYLFLGQSETLSPQTSILFHQIDTTHNLFIKH